MTLRRIGLLGGTFDPIHAGHLDLAAAAERALHLTQVVLIPANVPPHRPKPLTSGFHRFAMVALAVAKESPNRIKLKTNFISCPPEARDTLKLTRAGEFEALNT